MKTDPLHSLIFNGLYNSLALRKLPIAKQIWLGLWRYSSAKNHLLVSTHLFGQDVIINNGNNFKNTAYTYPRLNAPILACIDAAFAAHGPVRYIDIGVAIGDTPLMVFAHGEAKIEKIICIDGDAAFFDILSHNLRRYAGKVALVCQLLSAQEEEIAELVWDRNATANASGEGKVQARPLDSVLLPFAGQPVHVIKIDVDGFDGQVMAGAQHTLATHSPLVIFEWNSTLFARTGNDIIQPFQFLAANGYTRLVWFDNFGHFSHFSLSTQDVANNAQSLHALAQFCDENYARTGYHFDIIALPDSGPYTPNHLAKLAAEVPMPKV